MILDIFEFEFSQTLSPYPSFLSLLGYSIYVSINVSSCSPSSFLPSILHISLDFFACLANWIVLRCGCLSAAVPRDLCEFSDLPAFFGWFALFPSLLSTLPSGVWFLNKKARKRLFRAFFEHRKKCRKTGRNSNKFQHFSSFTSVKYEFQIEALDVRTFCNEPQNEALCEQLIEEIRRNQNDISQPKLSVVIHLKILF